MSEENLQIMTPEEKSPSEETQNSSLLKAADSTRFVDYKFGSLQTGDLTVTGEVIMSGIAMGNPVDGGTVRIPAKVSLVILQNTAAYTQLTITMPLQPDFGQTICLVSTVDVANVTFTSGAFGSTKPTELKANVALRFIFAGSWFMI